MDDESRRSTWHEDRWETYEDIRVFFAVYATLAERDHDAEEEMAETYANHPPIYKKRKTIHFSMVMRNVFLPGRVHGGSFTPGFGNLTGHIGDAGLVPDPQDPHRTWRSVINVQLASPSFSTTMEMAEAQAGVSEALEAGWEWWDAESEEAWNGLVTSQLEALLEPQDDTSP